MSAERVYWNTRARNGWGPGAWDGEPDKVQFRDAETGLPCLIVRAHVTGALCGYVGVSPGHPLYGKGYGTPEVEALEVHGGITFAEECRPGPEALAVCHVPDDGEPDHVFWFGFDCSHGFDVAPALDAQLKAIAPDLIAARELLPDLDGFPVTAYRTLGYVREECARLAQQLAGMK